MRNPRPYLGSFPCPTCLQSGDAVGAPWYSFQVSLMATSSPRFRFRRDPRVPSGEGWSGRPGSGYSHLNMGYRYFRFITRYRYRGWCPSSTLAAALMPSNSRPAAPGTLLALIE